MSNKSISVRSIKSDSQRALASHWDRLAGTRRFPALAEFKPDPGVAEVFNSAWAGKTMDQVVPISLRRFTLDAAKESATGGCLIYAIVSTIDANDHRVDCERLLMPFGSDDSKVEQILAASAAVRSNDAAPVHSSPLDQTVILASDHAALTPMFQATRTVPTTFADAAEQVGPGFAELDPAQAVTSPA